MAAKKEKILILDFGSQYTQLIARKLRELKVYSEIISYYTSTEKIKAENPSGLILSGGPKSVYDKNSFFPDKNIFELGVPILGICYGLQLITYQLNGKVKPAVKREYGQSKLKIDNKSKLFSGLPVHLEVWMSHGDEIKTVPQGFVATASTDSSVSAIEDSGRKIFGLQFHPEVSHTQGGEIILKNFVVKICGLKRSWTSRSFVETKVKEIKETIGDGKAICALSGGVDSTVAAILVAKAVGQRQYCIFVDTGLLRKGEYEEVIKIYKKLELNVKAVRLGDTFVSKLTNITDPEQKRKIIGAEFVKAFQKESRKLKGVEYLVQGTLYPDVIESSVNNAQSVVIKSHHNVGGLPKSLKLKLVEPLRELFKDEVRKVGRSLGLPDEIIHRQPFPGPGLAVRIIGQITKRRVRLLQKADKIVEEEIRKANLYNKVWQSFAIIVPISSVGVMGDSRTYEETIALRIVESSDGMTATWAKIPYEVLQKMSSRIVGEVKGINRVVYDISNKPPATIEWE